MIEHVTPCEDAPIESADPILCEWCRLPIALHPQDANGCYRCKVFKVKTTVILEA